MKSASFQKAPSPFSSLLASGIFLLAGGCGTNPSTTVRELPKTIVRTVEVVPKKIVKEVEKVPKEISRKVDRGHKDIRRGIADIVDGADRAFGESRVEDREKIVKLAVGLSREYRENRDSGFGLKLQLRLPLPALERRANIFLTLDSGLEQGEEEEGFSVPDSNTITTAATGFLTQLTDLLSFGAKIGIEWDGGPQEFIRFFTRQEKKWDPWRFFGEQQVYWKTDDGFGGKTIAQFDHPLKRLSFFRILGIAEYNETVEGLDLDFVLLYRKPFNRSSIISFETGVDFNTEEFHESEDEVNETFVRVRWIGKIWRQWLEYEVRPAVYFPWEGTDDVEFGIIFSLTVIFEDYLRRRDTQYEGDGSAESLLNR